MNHRSSSSWGVGVALLMLLLLAAQSVESTSPVFLWFNNHTPKLSSHNGIKDTIDYRTISQKDLAKVILSEGGWSSLLCAEGNMEQSVDIGVVLVGRELESSEIFAKQHADPTLMHLLKSSFTSSKSSIAFPYVSASSEGNKTMEASLISGFTESCGHELGVKNIAVLGSCSINAANYHKLADMQAVHEYLDSAMKNKQKGEKDLIVVCSGEGQKEQILSEGESFSELINSVEKSGASYSVLYASDPSRSKPSSSYRSLDRFLAEGNGSLYSSDYCDGVCHIKSSLLEGLLVGIVLLIILISGLCCMMGIDTPTRFEAPQD